MHRYRRLGAVFCAVAVTYIIGVVQVFAQGPAVVPPTSLYVNSSSKNKVIGLTPSQVRHAYGFDQITNRGAGQTIGIVVALDHPSIESDLAVFSRIFNLPECTTRNGCFEKVRVAGSPSVCAPFPSFVEELWQLESALDVEWAHAIAPEAKIMLVEAVGPCRTALLSAVDKAVTKGADVVSMSWGVDEFPEQTSFDLTHFVVANVSFVAASGDAGNPALWPAASPYVTAVGGTKLQVDSQGNINNETSWNDSGGGLSTFEVEPLYQARFNIPDNPGRKRGLPDVAYNAAPNAGFAVFNSRPFEGVTGWHQVGGTSAGAPQWAALLAITNSMRKAAHKRPLTGSNAALYQAAESSYTSKYNDITAGNNNSGQCGSLCTAGPGYDYVTGLGSPQANHLIPALVAFPAP